MTAPVRELLVVELLGGIGDTLLVLPTVHALADAYPGAAVRVLTYAPGDRLLATDPRVTEVVGLPGGVDPAAAVRDQLSRTPPDLVVSTTRHSGIPELLAATGARVADQLWRRPPPDELVDRRFLALLRADGVLPPGPDPLPAVHLTGAERAAGAGTLGRLAPGSGPVTVLLTGAGMPVKAWPADRWPVLAGELAGTGVPTVEVVPPGGSPAAGVPVLPDVDLRGLAAVFAAVAARRGVLVGADTGPLRLGSAAGAGTVGLFGPTAAARYGQRGPADVNLQGLPACPVRRPTAITEQECWWEARCPLAADPACMADLSVPQVTAAVRRVLAGRSGG